RLDTGDALGASSAYNPQVSSDGNGNVYVTWMDHRNGPKDDIYFNSSSDYGVTWQGDKRLDTGDTPGASSAYNPQISSDGKGNIYVTWEDSRNGSFDIYFNSSSDYGVTWKGDKRLDTGDALGASSAYNPQVSSDGNGNVYVTWMDHRNGPKDDIYFNSSSDYGVTWQGDKRLDTGDAPGASQSTCPQISSDRNGNVYVTWMDIRYGSGFTDIYFNSSSDYGATWQGEKRLDTGDVPGTNWSSYPRISNDGNGNVYVTWKDSRNEPKDDIYFNYSGDYGVTWQGDKRLDTGDAPGASTSSDPQISSDGNGNVYVAWDDRRNGNSDIYFNSFVPILAKGRPTSIDVTPVNPTIVQGEKQQFTATATYPDESTVELTTYTEWVSSNPSVATIDANGLATGISAGSIEITASLGEITSPFSTLTVFNVVDTIAPIITLSGSTPVNVEVGTAYNDEGATASDNVDGNITASIVTGGLPIDTSTPGSHTVTYDVTDSSGNAAIQVTRTVNVTDTTIPVITLSGSTPVNVGVGTTYNDEGATASDNVDGNITASIVTTGLPIDTSTSGSYIVTYDVADSSGNAAIQVKRTVNVTDTKVPVIILSGSTPVNVEVGTAYNDERATANDNVDGNITASIITGG
ncbi:MAG: DUF5011 domain-containing protein, partial [Gammaproteobacteria bacterium]|nr:DUF5011 domain-containing protein [Gammaproteobacteria bacterium]